jgi:hypothetical protein
MIRNVSTFRSIVVRNICRRLSAEPKPSMRGIDILRHPFYNKGMAFSELERDNLGIRGLLPPRVLTLEIQAQRVLQYIRRKTDDLEKYVALMALQVRPAQTLLLNFFFLSILFLLRQPCTAIPNYFFLFFR